MSGSRNSNNCPWTYNKVVVEELPDCEGFYTLSQTSLTIKSIQVKNQQGLKQPSLHLKVKRIRGVDLKKVIGETIGDLQII